MEGQTGAREGPRRPKWSQNAYAAPSVELPKTRGSTEGELVAKMDPRRGDGGPQWSPGGATEGQNGHRNGAKMIRRLPRLSFIKREAQPRENWWPKWTPGGATESQHEAREGQNGHRDDAQI